MGRKRIGELLLERGVITVGQLEEGLSFHRSSRQRLGVALVQKGFLREEQLSRILSEALAIPEVDLQATTPDWSAVQLLRPRFCESNDLFPYALENTRGRKLVLVAMADPLNLPAVEEIEFTTGYKVSPRLAPLSRIRAAILRYHYKVNPEDAPDGKMTVIQPGGTARVVDTAGGAGGEEEVLVGEELGPHEVTARTELAELIRRREEQRAARKGQRASARVDAVSKDLGYLFGADDDESVEKLERKFWALMRIMAKKGLITKEEFLTELDEQD